MASLLERIAPIDDGSSNINITDHSQVGPVRNNSGGGTSRGSRRLSSSPYSRGSRLGHSEADAAAVWKHDLYQGPGQSLESRLSKAPAQVSTGSGAGLGVGAAGSNLRVDASGAALALRQAAGLGLTTRSRANAAATAANLNIKGASAVAVGSNIVQVDNLAGGTSAADVEAIFKRCGPIVESFVHGPANGKSITVRLKFKNTEDARKAVQEYDGKAADGNVLAVAMVGSSGMSSLSGRLLGAGSGSPAVDGAVAVSSVDVLMEDDPDAFVESKMRSDELLSDPRAQVLTAPPGVSNASDRDQQTWTRGRGGRGRGGGRRGRGGRGAGARRARDAKAEKMMVD